MVAAAWVCETNDFLSWREDFWDYDPEVDLPRIRVSINTAALGKVMHGLGVGLLARAIPPDAKAKVS